MTTWIREPQDSDKDALLYQDGDELQTWHNLKVLTDVFGDLLNRSKMSDFRKDDRGFAKGDYLVLREFDGDLYTGRLVVRQVGYILYGGLYNVPAGYCILQLK